MVLITVTVDRSWDIITRLLSDTVGDVQGLCAATQFYLQVLLEIKIKFVFRVILFMQPYKTCLQLKMRVE